MTDVECLVIDAETRLRDFKNLIRWTGAAGMLAWSVPFGQKKPLLHRNLISYYY